MLMRKHHGFTLLELTMVLAVSGLMLGFVMNMAQSKTASRDECASTKTQMIAIRGAIEAFARKNDRLPLPAARNVGPENITYGRESSGANIDAAAGVSFGALPFQALGLPISYAGDCWGNKYTYAVTTALTTNAASGGFLDTLVTGNITLKDGSGNTINTTTAYAIISHGEDALGAAKLGFTAANPTHGWCTGAATLKYTNCLATAAVLADGTFNNGKDAGAAYYDDIIVAAAKPSILSTATSNAYCWGDNTNGQLGDSTTTQRTIPTLVSGGIQFSQISTGLYHTCGLDRTGNAYCWGDNSFNRYQIGGAGASSAVPIPVAVGLTFTQIQAGEGGTLALAANGTAYCWGYNGNGDCGMGGMGGSVTPTVVLGGPYSQISFGYEAGCGVTTAGVGKCWGYDYNGALGNGAAGTTGTPTVVNGGLTFKLIRTNMGVSCGITTTGNAYCWGNGIFGQIGDGNWSQRDDPTAVAGGLKFMDIVPGYYNVCALTTDGDAYCWGNNSYGQLGINSATGPYNTPQAVAGGHKFIKLMGSYWGYCGETADEKTYCWGRNNYGQIGDGFTGDANNRYAPTLITAAWPLIFGSVSNSGESPANNCALQPLPPVAWGANGLGAVGDSTNIDRPYPTYMTMPADANYFTAVAKEGIGNHRCALSDTGKAYCTGYNANGQVGGGDTNDQNKLRAVTMPLGVTFTKLFSGNHGTYAAGSDNKPYYWGGADVGDGGLHTNPTVFTGLPTNILSAYIWVWGHSVLGTNNQAYVGGVLETLPGGVTSVKSMAHVLDGVCIIGNDDQLYCRGCNEELGNGTAAGCSATYVPATRPAPVTGWTEVSAGEDGTAWVACAIANTGVPYCWGYQHDGMTGENVGGWGGTLSPQPVIMPTGVTSFSDLFMGYQIVTAKGNDGNYYYWGIIGGIPWSPPDVYVPTKVPLPIGAQGYKSLHGRSGLVY